MWGLKRYKSLKRYKTKSSKPQKRRKLSELSNKELEDKAWIYFSVYIRKRDCFQDDLVRCITCPKIDHWRQMDAGHYITRQEKAVMFNEINVHGQCQQCNQFKNGKSHEYALVLRRMYGETILEDLDKMRREVKSDMQWRRELFDILEKYKALIKER